MKLNRHNFAEFFRTDYYTVEVKFIEEAKSPLGQPQFKKSYTYKVPKDIKVEVGDKLVVCTSNDLNNIEVLKIVQVWNVNTEPSIDEDSPFKYKWIVGKLAAIMAEHMENNEKDTRLKRAVAKLEQALERVSLRKQLEAAFAEIGEDERQELRALFGTDILGQEPKAIHNGKVEERSAAE